MDIVTFVLIHDYARYLQTSHELIQRERFPDGIIQAFVEGNPDFRRVGCPERLLARLPLSATSVPVHLLQRVARTSVLMIRPKKSFLTLTIGTTCLPAALAAALFSFPFTSKAGSSTAPFTFPKPARSLACLAIDSRRIFVFCSSWSKTWRTANRVGACVPCITAAEVS